MEQTERIRQMELRLERAAAAVMEFSAALDKFEAIREDIETLDKYYASEEWKQDFAYDEAGRLPADLKRGVLSEDGIWNLLSDVGELNRRMSIRKVHAEEDEHGAENEPRGDLLGKEKPGEDDSGDRV